MRVRATHRCNTVYLMHGPPTIIERFVGEVLTTLRARQADGAAIHTWRAGAIVEPRGRALQRDAERRRLLLLADRAAQHWVPTTVAVLQDDGLNELARQIPRARSREGADDAARQIGGLRDVLRQALNRPTTGGSPSGVASALSELQVMLRHVAGGSPDRPDATAGGAIPPAARGLVACFYEGAGFADGIPGEVRTTVTVLDALDDERTSSWGVPGTERTAGESHLHRSLVKSLMSTLAWNAGEITHAEDAGTLPEPLTVGRHRPDIAGRTPAGELFLGEAKLGPELFDTHTQEQLTDFINFMPDGERVALHLIVPQGWRPEVERAMRAATDTSDDNVVVHELGGLPGAPPPH